MLRVFGGCAQRGGIVLEYLIVSVFSGALAIAVLHHVNEVFKERMKELDQSTGDGDLPDFSPPELGGGR
jgi:hypothetical protein